MNKETSTASKFVKEVILKKIEITSQGGLLSLKHNGHHGGLGKVAEVFTLCIFLFFLNLQFSPLLFRLDHKFDLMYAKRAFVHW